MSDKERQRALLDCALVEDVESAKDTSWEQTLVDLLCLDDDAQGEHLSVLWEREVDATVNLPLCRATSFAPSVVHSFSKKNPSPIFPSSPWLNWISKKGSLKSGKEEVLNKALRFGAKLPLEGLIDAIV